MEQHGSQIDSLLDEHQTNCETFEDHHKEFHRVMQAELAEHYNGSSRFALRHLCMLPGFTWLRE